MQLMNREETVAEIIRVQDALDKTTSPRLKRDYGKHLKKLYQNLRYYDKHHK